MTAAYSEHPKMFKSDPFAFLFFVLLIPIAVGILFLMVWYVRCKATKVELVGSELSLDEGILNKSHTELDVTTVRTVKVYQSFLNRIFGVGQVQIYTSGDFPEFTVKGIPRPHDLRNLIKERS